MMSVRENCSDRHGRTRDWAVRSSRDCLLDLGHRFPVDQKRLYRQERRLLPTAPSQNVPVLNDFRTMYRRVGIDPLYIQLCECTLRCAFTSDYFALGVEFSCRAEAGTTWSDPTGCNSSLALACASSVYSSLCSVVSPLIFCSPNSFSSLFPVNNP